LALAAIALQIVLSFGHIHLGVAHASTISTIAAAANPVPEPLPAQPGHHRKAFCATCVANKLVAHSLVPSVPSLAEPATWGRIELYDCPGYVALLRWTTPFQSRAPPFA
jgi:hypothetical protein